MTKRKKEPPRELKVKPNILSGKVTKSKNVENIAETSSSRKMHVKLFRTLDQQKISSNESVALDQQKISSNESVAATPFLMRSFSQCTSTPMDVKNNHERSVSKESRKGRPRKQSLDFQGFVPITVSKPPLSPILMDIGNLKKTRGKDVNRDGNSNVYVGGNGNKENMFSTNTESQRSQQKKLNLSLTWKENVKKTGLEEENSRRKKNPKEADKNFPESSKTDQSRRRSVGVRKTAVESNNKMCDTSTQYRNNKSSNLRVRLTKGPLHSVMDSTASNKSLTFKNLRPTRRRASKDEDKSQDRTILKQLRADWSSTTFEETPNQTQQVREDHYLKKSLGVKKRRLTPLYEVTISESVISPVKPKETLEAGNKRKAHDVYSSSGEFESDDEKRVGPSKRAPTWRYLLDKSAPKVSSTRRSERLNNHLKTPIHNSQIEFELTRSEVPSEELQENSSKRAPIWQNLLHKSAESASTKCSSSPKVRTMRLRNCLKTGASNTTDSNQIELELRSDAIPNTIETNQIDFGLTRNETRGKESQEQSNDQKSREVPLSLNKALANTKSRRFEEMAPNESNEKGNELKNASDDGTAAFSQKSKNFLNKSNLIELILSSSAEADEENVTSKNITVSNCTNNVVANANCTKKFFHSRIENTTVEPKTVEVSKGVRRSARNRNQDKIYEFLSQSSHSSDTNDPSADIIKKLIKTGKVVVAKHKKGTGKSVIPRKRKQDKKGKNMTKIKDIPVNSKPSAKPQPLQEKVVHFVDDDSHFDDGGADFVEDESKRDQRGFSDLARSAMIKQAGKNENTQQRKVIHDRKKLLAMAQKFVGQSKPVRVSTPSASTSQFSPIAGSASPWRVDDDNLPNLFYFSRNSDNLPSFSSDHIPLTPPKNKSKSKSSFSSNDSNMENMAPPGAQARTDENPIQNSRRGLSNRSPLRAINILEVINLPPLSMNNILREKNKDETSKSVAKSRNDGETSFFGFEDMIDDDENDLTDITFDQSAIPTKEDLKEKLQRLKHLRPEQTLASTSKNPIKPVFDAGPKQKTIKQLCSTMIETPKQKKLEDNVQIGDFFNDGNDIDLSNLFKDPEPETTFDASNPRRTYSRPFIRKRKLRHNFVMFMDSDESGDEADKSYEQKTKKKKKKTTEDAELNKFVDEFNEMVKEVSQFELMVE